VSRSKEEQIENTVLNRIFIPRTKEGTGGMEKLQNEVVQNLHL